MSRYIDIYPVGEHASQSACEARPGSMLARLRAKRTLRLAILLTLRCVFTFFLSCSRLLFTGTGRCVNGTPW